VDFITFDELVKSFSLLTNLPIGFGRFGITSYKMEE
jgi:hypothetical protein